MNITIPDNTENINILLSGGADSTILLYLLSKQTDKPIICHSLNKKSNQIVVPIIEYLENMFGKRYHYFCMKKQNLFLRDAAKHILSVYPGVIFTGCNKVVTHFTPTVYLPGDTPPVRGPALNEHHLRPFMEMDKIDVLRLYLKENILDLLSITRSCGVSGIHRCGGCYFCMERHWAATELNIDDINNINISNYGNDNENLQYFLYI